MRQQAIYKGWDREELAELYKIHTAKELAARNNVSVSTIKRALHYYGIKKERRGKGIMMSMSIYINYKGMTIDIMGSVVVSKSKFKEIEDKDAYMFSVLINHIHGIGSTGLITIITNNKDIATIGYSDSPTKEKQRGFRWDRFIVNGMDYSKDRNKNMIDKSKMGGKDDKI